MKELNDLLEQLAFTADRADLRQGTHWSVYAHPWVRDEDDFEQHFDALITITPLSAAHSSNQGLYLVVQHENIIWLPQSVTNERGQAWFPQLPVKELFTVRVQGAVKVKDWREEGREAAFDLQQSKALFFHLADRRVVALLEEDEEGRAELTVETQAEALAEARVSFAFGSESGHIHESGHIQLTWYPRLNDTWKGSQPLINRFQILRTEIPTLTVAPNRQGIKSE